MPSKSKTRRAKVAQVMREYQRGTLHSGSGDGPAVRSVRQAKAIALSEAGLSGPPRRRISRKRRAAATKRFADQVGAPGEAR
jgi:hypothetical protein